MARSMGRDPAAIRTVASRSVATVPEQGYEASEIPTFIELQSAPRPSDEQGVGKPPGYQWPWQRRFQSLVPKAERQSASLAWPNNRRVPTRPEIHGWGAQYLLFYEQTNRHAWPAGTGAARQTIEHPQTVPWTSLAPRLF